MMNGWQTHRGFDSTVAVVAVVGGGAVGLNVGERNVCPDCGFCTKTKQTNERKSKTEQKKPKTPKLNPI